MSRIKDTLPLKEFMRRAQVLNLYRAMNRAARRVSDANLRQSLCTEIRNSFRQNQQLRDSMSLKSTLIDANRQLKQLRTMGEQSVANGPGTWLGESTEDDVRGRVGTGWPWMRQQ